MVSIENKLAITGMFT